MKRRNAKYIVLKDVLLLLTNNMHYPLSKRVSKCYFVHNRPCFMYDKILKDCHYLNSLLFGKFGSNLTVNLHLVCIQSFQAMDTRAGLLECKSAKPFSPWMYLHGILLPCLNISFGRWATHRDNP